MADNNIPGAPVPEETASLTDAFTAKVEKLKYPLLAGIVLLIAVAAIVSYSRSSAAKADAAARDKVFETLSTIQLGSKPASEGAVLFAADAKEFRGLPAGAQASLYEFSYLYNENQDYAVAEQALARFIADYPENPMIPRARLAMGQAMLQQGKVDGAIAAFRAVADSNNPELLPEAKLALAQALERRAEDARDASNPEEYRSRLEEAEAEYTDIITRAQISVPAQQGFWPQAVTLPADYALVQIKDKLAGHEYKAPLGAQAQNASAATDGVTVIPPPPASAPAAAPASVRPPEAEAEEAPAEEASEEEETEETPETTEE